MKSVLLTGSTGFLGKNLLKRIAGKYEIRHFSRGQTISVNEDMVIHLAGKAHDLKNVSNPDDYYQTNTDLTKQLFDQFLASNASVFIFISSVKAVKDTVDYAFTEEEAPTPVTHYGISKLLAEQYILSQKISSTKQVYILRPCMIHGPGNKGNLNLLFKLVQSNIPWPLVKFENRRSFCSVSNICFVIEEMISNRNVASGIYNVCDDGFVSTNSIIQLISKVLGKKPLFIPFPKKLILNLAKLGDRIHFPLNSERLNKLTEDYMVSNAKIKKALGILEMPTPAIEGLIETLSSFSKASNK